MSVVLRRDSRYMRMKSDYVARTAEELSVPAGGLVFMFSEADTNGMATVIYDGKVGVLSAIFRYMLFFFLKDIDVTGEYFEYLIFSVTLSVISVSPSLSCSLPQKGLLPLTMLEAVDPKKAKRKKKIDVSNFCLKVLSPSAISMLTPLTSAPAFSERPLPFYAYSTTYFTHQCCPFPVMKV